LDLHWEKANHINNSLTMNETQYYHKDIDLWHQLIDQEKTYLSTRQNFLNSPSKVDLIRKALKNPLERPTALKIIHYLTQDEGKSLFNELIKLASVGHSDIELVRHAIFSYDKTWLLENIETQAKSVLENGTDEEYRQLLELYIQLDDKLTQRLIIKALQHQDIDIQEVGEDFQNYLKNQAG
jgi:tRNA A37 N6-isopentenylltransferase MiaA